MTLRLQPQDRVLAAGHRLGLLLSLSDTENTSPATTGATVTVDLAHSGLGLPVAGPARFGTPRTAPEVTAPAATAPHRPERAMP